MTYAYGGQKEWKGCEDVKRVSAIENVLDFLSSKPISIVFSATHMLSWDGRLQANCPMARALQYRWLSQAFHVALSVNKANRNIKANKGKTIMIFDRGAGHEIALANLLVSPPTWSDTYYAREKKEEALGEIIDTSFFVDSSHAPLIQLADTVAFIIRRYAEMNDIDPKERYPGEFSRIEHWMDMLKPKIQDSAHRYKKVKRCPAGDLFWDIAPPSLRSIA